MEFRVLGNVEMSVDGRLCELGSAKERFLLAILLLAAGQPVSMEAIIDRIWGERPPPKARESVHSYVARLRGRVQREMGAAEARVVSRSGAYALEIDPECVDVHRFRRLQAQAFAIADSGDDDEALRLLHEAERLWRGEPLSGLSGEWVRRQRTGLENDYRAVVGRRIKLQLDAGRHADLVGELYRLTARYPYDESFVEQLMLALYRCGRAADALETFHENRRELVDAHGTEPVLPSLRGTYDAILHGNPELAIPPGPRRAPLADDLPRDTPDFTGRETELTRLYAALERTPNAVVITAIDGMPGVGKSALAVHLAHRRAERYPDGRLFLDLRAHDRTHPPVDPAEGLRTLLRLVNEDPRRIPATLEECAAMWRARLADRRVLILLDDAASTEQVAPFLPGAPGCLVLVTSRSRLTGLNGVRSLSLDVLAPRDAALLFRQVVGDDRPLDAKDVDEVVQLCGHLPLAITLVATRLRHRPARGVGDLVAKLSRTKDRLAEIHAGGSDLAGAFELSYRELPPARRRAFRRLGLYVGADIGTDAAAALIGCDRAAAERAVEELIDDHLVEEAHPARIRFHDLLREYADQRAAADEPADERRRAVHRLLDFYLHTADRADRTLYPYRGRDTVDVSHPPTDPPDVDTPDSANAWLRAERANVLACVRYAAEHGFPEHAIELPWALAVYLDHAAHWEEAAIAHDIARMVSRDRGNRRGEARAERELCLVRSQTGRYDTALEHAHAALGVSQESGDRPGEAEALARLARVCWLSGRYRDALSHAERAVAIFRAAGDRRGEGTALLQKGIALKYLGQVDLAAPAFEDALRICGNVGDRFSAAMSLNNIGEIKFDQGYHRDALETFREVLAIMRADGWRQNVAVALNNIANVHRYKGRYDEALHFYRQALNVYQETGDRRNEADALSSIGATYLQLERHAEALIHFQKALSISQDIGDGYEEARALHEIGEAQREGGRFALARESYQRALVVARDASGPYLVACCLQGLGEVALHTRGRKSAEILWRQALAAFDPLGAPEAEALRVRLQAFDATGT